jgi:hypothetical protein
MRRSNRGRNSVRRPRRSNNANSNRPSQIRSNIEVRHKYRFTSTSGTLTALTAPGLLAAAGNVCTVANNTVTSFFGTVKINSIEMWSPPAAQGSSVTCSCDWAGYQNSPNQEVSDTSVSVSTPAHIRAVPPRQSLASFWVNEALGTGTICQLIAPTGTIIDVDLSLILQDDEEPATATGVATGTLGSIYYLSLDPNATHRYVPVSLTTTI